MKKLVFKPIWYAPSLDPGTQEYPFSDTPRPRRVLAACKDEIEIDYFIVYKENGKWQSEQCTHIGEILAWTYIPQDFEESTPIKTEF